MHDRVLVQMLHRAGHVDQQPHAVLRRHRPFGQPVGQAAAGHVLHGKVVLPLHLADFEDVDDVRMAQARRRLGLGLKAADLLLARPIDWPGSS